MAYAITSAVTLAVTGLVLEYYLGQETLGPFGWPTHKYFVPGCLLTGVSAAFLVVVGLMKLGSWIW